MFMVRIDHSIHDIKHNSEMIIGLSKRICLVAYLSNNLTAIDYNGTLSDVTLPDRRVVPATDQTITCQISDITQLASVTWKNDDESDLDHSVEGYTVNQGEISDGVQESTLIISSAKLQTLETSTTFTCVVHSGQYADSSPEVTKTMTLTTLTFGT